MACVLKVMAQASCSNPEKHRYGAKDCIWSECSLWDRYRSECMLTSTLSTLQDTLESLNTMIKFVNKQNDM